MRKYAHLIFMIHKETLNLYAIAKRLKDEGMRCNCDLDNWEPEKTTGHSHVCRIHKRAIAIKYRPYDIAKLR